LTVIEFSWRDDGEAVVLIV